jgi:PleD family two-component response regulator
MLSGRVPRCATKRFGISRISEMPNASGTRILVVDDESAIRDLMRVVLVASGYHVDAA